MKGLPVSGRELERKLGPKIMGVFRRLVRSRRAADGVCWASVARLTTTARGTSPCSPRTVERALALFRELGLVSQPALRLAGRYDGPDGADGLGWQTVPMGAAGRPRRVFVRVVQAEPCPPPRLSRAREWYLVRPLTARAIEARRSWSNGGARPGAGAPRRGDHRQGVPAKLNIQLAGTPANQLAADQDLSSASVAESTNAFASLRHARTTEVMRVSLTSIVGGRDQSERTTEIGTRLGGARRAAPSLVGVAGVPPFPTVTPARTPNPPLLDPEAGNLERAHSLMRAYNAAINRKFPPRPNRAGKVRPHGAGMKLTAKSKLFPTLVEAAQLLIDHEIAPAAWCTWSCDIWRDYGNGKGNSKKPPPLAWVLGPKRISERYGWFAAEESGYSGGRAIVGPVLKQLLTRYYAMESAIFRADAYLNPEVVVKEFFPGDTYEQMVKAARAECAATAEQLVQQAADGVQPW